MPLILFQFNPIILFSSVLKSSPNKSALSYDPSVSMYLELLITTVNFPIGLASAIWPLLSNLNKRGYASVLGSILLLCVKTTVLPLAV
jgi:hypothetical protein